jgi:hypothetical protein
MRGVVLTAVGLALAGATLPARAADIPLLGAARSFAILGGSDQVTNTGSDTAIVGDVGISPGTAITGLTASQVTGGSIHSNDSLAQQAHSDASIAYSFLKGMASIPANNLSDQNLGGMTLLPAVYKFDAAADLTGDLVLDAGGDSSAIFVFQIGSTLITATGATVKVINGGADYDESNVYWQVGSSATLNTGTAFVGNILAYASISIKTGSTMVGNALAIGAAVTMESNSVTSPPIPPEGAPAPLVAAPINLTAVLGGSHLSPHANLSWTDQSDNETEFRVYRREGAGPDFVLIASTSAAAGTGSTVTYPDPVLTPETIYTYRVTAYLAPDESAPSNEALVDTSTVNPAVNPPLNLTAVAMEVGGACTGVELTWMDDSDNETEFRIYRREGAGPDFLLVGAAPAAASTESTVTFEDLLLVPATTYTYRVTAYLASDGVSPAEESEPSNEALVQTCTVVPPPTRWLDVHLGRRRSLIRDRTPPGMDRVIIRGSFSVIDIATGVPTVVDDMDPRVDGCGIQVTAPGNLVLLSIPADDSGWKKAEKGVYLWTSHDRGNGPAATLRINTRRSEFTLKSGRNEFSVVPVNSITVTLTCGGATGFDTQPWIVQDKFDHDTGTLLTSPPSHSR